MSAAPPGLRPLPTSSCVQRAALTGSLMPTTGAQFQFTMRGPPLACTRLRTLPPCCPTARAVTCWVQQLPLVHQPGEALPWVLLHLLHWLPRQISSIHCWHSPAKRADQPRDVQVETAKPLASHGGDCAPLPSPSHSLPIHPAGLQVATPIPTPRCKRPSLLAALPGGIASRTWQVSPVQGAAR